MKISKKKVDIVLARKCIYIKDLANTVGMSRTRISTELNSDNVAPITIGKIAAALGVDVTDIIEESVKKGESND